MSLHRICLYLFVMLVLLVSDYANAESVLIRTPNGTEGQGWLFGAHAGEKCWIAVPVHVVTSKETGKLVPFNFFDGNGNCGESAMPIRGVPTGRNAAGDRLSTDLAFARVKLGRYDGQCHSRLGLPLYAYDELLKQRKGFFISSTLKTSAAVFDVTLDSKSNDPDRGAAINFSVDAPNALQFVHQGISGATVFANYRGKRQPVAMVLRVSDAQKTIHALRYDYIKKLFKKIDWPDTPAYRKNKDDGTIHYEIIQSKYIPVSANMGASNLQSDSGCWKAIAPGGSRIVELVIAVRDSNTKVKTLEVEQSAQCKGAPVKFWVQQRASSDDAWISLTDGICRYGIDNPLRINLSGPREFRLKFEASKPVIISRLRLR